MKHSNTNFYQQKNQNQKKLFTVLEIINTSPKYVTIEGQIVDQCSFDKNTKIKIKDKSCDKELSIALFDDLHLYWQDKIINGNWYIFKEFVNHEFNGDIQLKNNKYSKIEVSQKQDDSDNSSDESVIQKTASLTNNRVIKQNTDFNLQSRNKNYSSFNNMVEFNKTVTVNQIIEEQQASKIGENKEFIVYGYLGSIYMKKLFEYCCQRCDKFLKKSDSYFCVTCQYFTDPQIKLIFTGFIYDGSGTIPITLLGQNACFLINLLDPKIKCSDAGQFIKNSMENGKEEVVKQLFNKLDGQRFKFDLQIDNKEFSYGQDMPYKLLKIYKENNSVESKYLSKQS